MARSRQVTIQFLGDSKGLVDAANRAGRSTTTLGDKLKRVGTAAAIGFAGATVIAGKAAWDFAEAAVEDEKSATLMANALKNATGATRDQIAAVEDWISKQGELLGVTDDELRPAISRLAGATGDIGEAQDLAALAMDVSVGKGKDLKTVYEALAKGVDGNIGAIGRLGVKTKDAEGNTKSLKDITAELADLYGGSAAKAADTAAGKFERTKVALAETAESIGYKLLPYVNDFGDWLVDDGVPGLENLARSARRELGPALQDLAGWVGDNKDEFIDMGQEVAGTVLPALKTTGEVVGDLVGFFNGLPGPVKDFGVQAGIAAAILPKLNGALAIGKFQAFAGAVGDAEKRTGALQGAAKAAAGAGGLMLLLDSANQTNDGLAALEGAAGGAALGFAVGGPWGAAIGGAAGLIGKIATASNETREAAEKAYRDMGKTDGVDQAVASLDDLKSTLDQVTGAYTGATRAAVLDTLQKSGALEAGAKFGLTQRQMIDGAMGQRGAFAALKPVLDDYDSQIAAIDEQQRALTESSSSYELVARGGGRYIKRMTTDALEQAAALDEQRDELVKARTEVEKMPGALRQQGKETREAAAATADYTGKLKGLPANVKTDILQNGIEPSTRAIANLTKKYDLTPKQVKTLIEASGADSSAAKVQNLIDKMNRLHDKTITITTVQRNGVRSGGGGHTADEAPVGKTKADLVGRIMGRGAQGGDFQLVPPYMLEQAGNELITSIVRGLNSGGRTLKNALQGVQDYIQSSTDRLNDLLGQRSGFVDSFRSAFSESIFGAQFTDASGMAVPPSLQRMLDFAMKQRSNATSLASNISALLGKGLSNDLIRELVSQGQSGYDQIAALAMGTDAQIQQFNQLAAETKATLDGIGLDIYNRLNPAAQADIELAQAAVALGQQQLGVLERLAAKDIQGEVKIKGTDIVIALRAVEKATGKQLLVSK